MEARVLALLREDAAAQARRAQALGAAEGTIWFLISVVGWLVGWWVGCFGCLVGVFGWLVGWLLG